MHAEFLRTTTEDKLVLEGLLYSPDTNTSTAALFIHGIQGNFYRDRFITHLAKNAVEKNIAFLTVNTRGHDPVSKILVSDNAEDIKIGAAFELFEESIFDIKAWINYLLQRGFKKIILVGHSLGSSKIIYYLSKNISSEIYKVICIAPTPLNIIANLENHEEITNTAIKMAQDNKSNELMPHKLFGTMYMSSKTYLGYVHNNDAMSIFNVFDNDSPSLLEQVTVPLYVVWGSKDKYQHFFKLNEALEYIKKKAINSKVTSAIIEGAAHSFKNYEDQLTEIVGNWMKIGN